jgi:hypothetical protein
VTQLIEAQLTLYFAQAIDDFKAQGTFKISILFQEEIFFY